MDSSKEFGQSITEPTKEDKEMRNMNQNNMEQKGSLKRCDVLSLLLSITAIICILLSFIEGESSNHLLCVGLSALAIANTRNHFWNNKRRGSTKNKI